MFFKCCVNSLHWVKLKIILGHNECPWLSEVFSESIPVQRAAAALPVTSVSNNLFRENITLRKVSSVGELPTAWFLPRPCRHAASHDHTRSKVQAHPALDVFELPPGTWTLSLGVHMKCAGQNCDGSYD